MTDVPALMPEAPGTPPAIGPQVGTVPAGALYWDLLPSTLRRAPRATQDFHFEQVLPVPVDSLHTARTTLPSGETLVVGLPPEALRQHLLARTSSGTECWQMIPDSLPEAIRAAGVDETACARLGLLHGPFEPLMRRRARRQVIAVAAGALVLALGLLVVGVERRAVAWREQAREVRRDTLARIGEALPAEGAIPMPADRRLAGELARLQGVLQSHAQRGGQRDVVPALEALWSRWPKDLRLQVEAVTASSERLTIRGFAPDVVAAERLAQACGGLADGARSWRAEPIQVDQAEGGARFMLTLAPRAAAAGGQP